jgi:tetratricopeptide (TPR) repeat protein
MSLLMKALEKAAKDRNDSRVEPVQSPVPATAAAAAAAAPKTELTLEPIAAEPPPSPPSAKGGGADVGGAAASPARGPAAPAAARGPAQAQASTILQAGGTSRPAGEEGGIVEYVRAHPLPMLGLLAALFAAGFGVYVYFQIARPGVSVGQPPLAPKVPPPPPVEAPLASAAVPAASPEPLASAPLLREAAAEAAATRRPKPAPAVAAEEAGPRNTVVVSRGNAAPALNPLLGQAYAALQAGQLDQARRDYGLVAAAEPKNVNALLGLAAIAVRIGDNDEATRRYLQILEIEPRHALAQAGLLALLGRADPVAAESRLRHLISLDPSAYLYFVLGNLYADQSQWAPAQQAYFQAHHLEPANPDYAYNLAVGLEHVSQYKLALGYYRRAVQLAAARGRANFNLSQAQERIGNLAAQVE